MGAWPRRHPGKRDRKVLVALAAILAAALLRLVRDGKEVGGKSPLPPSEKADGPAGYREPPGDGTL